MKLTPQEEAYTREVAAEIGREPEDLIREGEQLKEDGYREAQAAAEREASWTGRSHAAGGLGMYAGRYSDPLADPDIMAAERRREAGADREAGQ
jgi:hypothetical protein